MGRPAAAPRRGIPAAPRGFGAPPLASCAREVFDLACRRLEAVESRWGLSGWLAEFVGKRLAAVQ